MGVKHEIPTVAQTFMKHLASNSTGAMFAGGKSRHSNNGSRVSHA